MRHGGSSGIRGTAASSAERDQKAHGTAVTRSRLPITGSLICKLIDQLLVETSLSLPDRRMLQAAVLLAFHGFLRCAEFVAPEHTRFDPKFDAARDSVSVRYYNSEPVLVFHVKRSKTDPYAKGMAIYIGKAPPPYCPIAAMVEYLTQAKLADSDPLFRLASGTPLTRQFLMTKVRNLLTAAGIPNAEQYGGHSVCIGAATSAAPAGVPEWQNRAMGRWQSDCVL